MKHKTPVEFSFSTTEFRSLPIPSGNGSSRIGKLATCFVRAQEVPPGLEAWMEVNPRVPKQNKRGSLQGPVAKAMLRTPGEEPELFALKNQGMYLLAKDVSYAKEEGGKGVVTVVFDDPETHGLVNGGHTYLAIRQVAEERDTTEPWDAFVRLHIMEDIDEGLITDLAEGLNRSMQVDNPSLENLRGTFDEIKAALGDKSGAKEIAYRQGDTGDIDILHILTIMGMFDLDRFPDRKIHPHILFGHPKEVLSQFVKDAEKKEPAYKRVLPRLHEILVLADRIQQAAVKDLATLKVSPSKSGNRVASPRHKGKPAYFSGGTINGNLPLGYLYPMLGAFRANASPSAWKAGRLEWLMDPTDLLASVKDEMAQIIKQEHKDSDMKPAEVGKREAAYRACYSVVTMELAQRGLLS